MKKTLSTFFLVVAALTLIGCGSAENNASSTPDTTLAGNTQGAEFNDDDVMFAQMMIPHHEQALEMADIALDPTVGAGEQVRSLAARIKASQEPEIETMTGLLVAWGKPTAMDESMDHSEMMSGMLTAAELDELGTLSGTVFDSAWLDAMIRHHEGAIDMANDVLAKGTNTSLASLAKEIIAAQQAEIAEMSQSR